ncbi:MAG: acyl-CoA dehydrogenase, partial [Frankiales bacterium]|nr:acyl-CoA dehydrogenase [Frankiales bacterium]
MDSEQIELLSTTLRDVLSGPPEGVDARLTELGWDDVVADDPATATRLLFTEHGRALATTSLLDRLVLDALEVPAGAVAFPRTGDRPTSGQAGVSGLLLHLPAPGSTVAVPVQGGVALVPVEELTVTPLEVFDPALHWFSVTGPAPAASSPADWPGAVAVAHRALAAELIGAAGEVLRLAVEHTSSRTQFGAPIAAFQAVRHRLADSHVAIAAAQSLLLAAFLEGSPASARAAKAQAGRAHELAAANALQVCGAMGSTLEHPLHTFISRGVALDVLLGGWAEQTASMGR